MTDRLTKLLAFHEADPTDAFVCYGIAMEYLKAADKAQAAAWLDKTLVRDRDYAYAYYQKAKLLLETGDKAVARATLEAGLDAAARKSDAKATSELTALLELTKG